MGWGKLSLNHINIVLEVGTGKGDQNNTKPEIYKYCSM